jgi:hypothetical protein
VNDLVQKSCVGAIGSIIAVTTQETSQMLSLIASGCTIVFMLLSIIKLIRSLRKKKNVK